MAESAYERARRHSAKIDHHEEMHKVIGKLANTVQVGVTDAGADAFNEHINSAYSSLNASHQFHKEGLHHDADVHLQKAADHVYAANSILAQHGVNYEGMPWMEASTLAHNYSLSH